MFGIVGTNDNGNGYKWQKNMENNMVFLRFMFFLIAYIKSCSNAGGACND